VNVFALNLLLALVWAALNTQFTLGSLATGFALGFIALWLCRPLLGVNSSYFVRFWRVLRLGCYFLYELLLSSLRVAWEVLTPQQISTPSIVEVPLEAAHDLEILVLSNLISLTPGTLSLDVSEDRSRLTVHAMFAGDPDSLVRTLRDGMIRRVREVFEP